MHVSSDPSFWDGMNEKFYKKYNQLDTTHHKWKDVVMAGKPLVGPLGRSWTVPIGRNYRGEIKVPWNALTNFPVQGTGADVMMLVRLAAHKRINDAAIECDFISTVHDSIVIDTREKHLEQIRDLMDGVFADIPAIIHKTFGYTWQCPMACESKYGPNMLDMRKFS